MLLRSLILVFICNISLAQTEVKMVGIKGLKALMSDDSQKHHVINFWATWCGPCIEELPYFDKIKKEYQNKGVKFSFVSMDFSANSIKPFLTKKGYDDFDVYLMTDLDYNKWIDLVDKEWQGEIPATLFVSNANGRRIFKAGSFTEKSLRKTVEQLFK